MHEDDEVDVRILCGTLNETDGYYRIDEQSTFSAKQICKDDFSENL